MFLTLFNSEDKELRTLVFGSDGKAELIGIFNSKKRIIKDQLLKDQQVIELAHKWGMSALGVQQKDEEGNDEENTEVSVAA